MIGDAIVLALVLALDTLPTLVARRLITSELEALGIAAEGLSSLDVEILDGTIALGPVRLVVSGGPPPEIATLEADVDLGAPLADRLVFERLSLAGVELQLEPTAPGGFKLNGLPVRLPGAAPGGSVREAVRRLLGGRDLGPAGAGQQPSPGLQRAFGAGESVERRAGTSVTAPCGCQPYSDRQRSLARHPASAARDHRGQRARVVAGRTNGTYFAQTMGKPRGTEDV